MAFRWTVIPDYPSGEEGLSSDHSEDVWLFWVFYYLDSYHCDYLYYNLCNYIFNCLFQSKIIRKSDTIPLPFLTVFYSLRRQCSCLGLYLMNTIGHTDISHSMDVLSDSGACSVQTVLSRPYTESKTAGHFCIHFRWKPDTLYSAVLCMIVLP